MSNNKDVEIVKIKMEASSQKAEEGLHKLLEQANINFDNKTFNTKDIVTFGYPSTGSIDNNSINARTNMPSVKTVASPMYTPWKQQDEETITNRMNILRRKKRAGKFIR